MIIEQNSADFQTRKIGFKNMGSVINLCKNNFK